jgi:hypothetical protein
LPCGYEASSLTTGTTRVVNASYNTSVAWQKNAEMDVACSTHRKTGDAWKIVFIKCNGGRQFRWFRSTRLFWGQY